MSKKTIPDKGLNSRKLWFTIFAVFSAFLFPVVAVWKLPTLLPLYQEFCSTLIALTGLYLVGNVGSKYVFASNAHKFKQTEEAPVKKGPPVEPGPDDLK